MLKQASLRAPVAIVLIALATSACSKDSSIEVGASAEQTVKNLGMPCDANDASGYCGAGSCVAGLCRVKCETDSACEGGSICITDPVTKVGGCRLPSEADCSLSQACPTALLKCGIDGSCRSPCTEQLACPRQDQQCISGSCFGSQSLECDTAGAHRCVGTELQVCNTLGLGWKPLETCLTPGLCSASLDSGKCVDPLCDKGDGACDGRTLMVCNEDRTGYTTTDCATPALCQLGRYDGACRAPVCDVGEKRCEGSALRICNEDRTGYDTVTMCESAGLCEAGLEDTGECQEPVCAPGILRCDGSTLERCNADRTGFETVATCETNALCTAGLQLGACKEAECQPGDKKCEGASLRACNAGQTGYYELAACESAGLCQLALTQTGEITGCIMSACEALQFECAPSNGGSDRDLMVCKYDQTEFVKVATCDTPELCTLGKAIGACAQPVCSPGQARCQGRDLQLCNEGRTGFETVDSCYSNVLCEQTLVQTNPSQCNPPVCTEPTCDGSSLRPCKADGTGWLPIDSCQTPELCELGKENIYTDPLTSIVIKGICEEPTCSHGGFGLELTPGGWLARLCNEGQTGWDDLLCSGDTPMPTCKSVHSQEQSTAICLGPLGIGKVFHQSHIESVSCIPKSEVGETVLVGHPGSQFGMDPYPVPMEQWVHYILSKAITFEAYSMSPTNSPEANVTFDMTGLPPICQDAGKSSFNGGYGEMFFETTLVIPHPVTNVDWCDAYMFCAAHGKRLCGGLDGGPAEYNTTDPAESELLLVCTNGGTSNAPWGDVTSGMMCSAQSWESVNDCAAPASSNFSGVYLVIAPGSQWENACETVGTTTNCMTRGMNGEWGMGVSISDEGCYDPNSAFVGKSILDSWENTIRCCETPPP